MIQSHVPGLTTIIQKTDRAVIDWQSFSIGAGEHANFIVPNSSSATLNRVLGCDPSILNGSLTSNGHVFLINSNGIVFGQGSMVDVAGLTASALNIDNGAFMAGGEMVFSGSSEAKVRNAGVIKASSGDVFLIGYQVSNTGTIQAPNGTVGLAAGSEVLIRPAGDERVVVRTASGSHKKFGVSNSGVIEANVAELKAHGGNVYAMAIRNTGRVAATGVTTQGGRILLTADGGKIQSTGTLSARRQAGNGGEITVNAGKRGSVDIGGRVDADGPGGSGGKVMVHGEQVTIRRAIAVTADGKTAGGEIEIGSKAVAGTEAAVASQTHISGMISASSSHGTGGEIRLGGASLLITDDAVVTAGGLTGGGRVFAGGGWALAHCGLLESTQVTIDCDVLMEANAIQNGSGGIVMVTAEKDLIFRGKLSARGGAMSGDGGLAELSAGMTVTIDRLSGHVDLGAAKGNAGRLLLLSSEWEVSNRCNWTRTFNVLDDEDVSSFLNSANLAVQTVLGSGGGNGNIALTGTVAWSAANSLTLSADCDFLLLNSAGAGVIDSLGGGEVTVNAARSVLLEACTRIGSSTGSILLQANQRSVPLDGDFRGITVAGEVSTRGGSITLAGRAGSSSAADTPAILVDGGVLNAASGGVITLKTTGGIVVSHGSVTASGLILSGSSDFTLTGPGNSFGTVATSGIVRSLTLENSTALTIGKIGAARGLNATAGIRVSAVGTEGMVIRESVISQGGGIDLSAENITVNGATVSSAGSGSARLSAGGFVLVNQPVIRGLLRGTGPVAWLNLNDSNLTQNQSYTVTSDKITAGTRDYSFQNVAAIRLDLGAGNDRIDTDFFSYVQLLIAGQGADKLFVGGFQPTNSPLTKPGFGTITHSGFTAGTTILIDGTPFGSLLLQGAQPGAGAGGGNGSQTNNFNMTSVGGAAGLAAALGAAGGSGGLLANVTNTMSQNLGFVSTGGGAPPSLSAQSQMNAAISAAVESELNAALGGDGTMGVRSNSGLVSVNPNGPPPSAVIVAQLQVSMGLEALSELAFSVFGVNQVTLNNQFGAQALQLGSAPPPFIVQQKMDQIASPESYSTLSASLGGDGIARVESVSGFIAVDLRSRDVPTALQDRLMGIFSPGSVGELMQALGGTGEAIVHDSQGALSMHAAGTNPGARVSSSILAMLAAPHMSQMSLVLGGTGSGVMNPRDGIVSTALDAELPGPFVKARLAEATSLQSVAELDDATR